MLKAFLKKIFKESVITSPSNNAIISNDGVIGYFDENIKHIDLELYGINRNSPEMEKHILSIIRRGLIMGLSYVQIGSNIYKEFAPNITKQQGKEIAVHILGLSYGGSSYIDGVKLAQEGYILEKEWITSHDNNVCKSCLENEAIGPIPFSQTFPSGDIFAPRKKEINCRCTITHRIIGIKK